MLDATGRDKLDGGVAAEAAELDVVIRSIEAGAATVHVLAGLRHMRGRLASYATTAGARRIEGRMTMLADALADVACAELPTDHERLPMAWRRLATNALDALRGERRAAASAARLRAKEHAELYGAAKRLAELYPGLDIEDIADRLEEMDAADVRQAAQAKPTVELVPYDSRAPERPNAVMTLEYRGDRILARGTCDRILATITVDHAKALEAVGGPIGRGGRWMSSGATAADRSKFVAIDVAFRATAEVA